MKFRVKMLEKMKELCQKKMDGSRGDNAHGHCLLAKTQTQKHKRNATLTFDHN